MRIVEISALVGVLDDVCTRQDSALIRAEIFDKFDHNSKVRSIFADHCVLVTNRAHEIGLRAVLALFVLLFDRLANDFRHVIWAR